MAEISEQEFLHYYADIQRRGVEQRSQAGDVSALKKRAKEAGIDLQILIIAAKFAKLDPVEYIAKLNRLMTYLSYLRLKGAAQLVPIQNIDQSQPKSPQDHFDEGFSVGINGGTLADCTLDFDKKAGKKWKEGFDLAISMLDGTANVVKLKVVENEPPEPDVELPADVEPRPEPMFDDNPPPEGTPAFLIEKKAKPKKKAKAKLDPEPEPEVEVTPVTSSIVDRLLKKHGGS